MSERDMRQRVIRALAPLDAISVENRAYPGTPDVNYVGGWLELKWLREWPKRAESPVVIGHLTQQQKVWLFRRMNKQGNAYLVLQCKKQWLVYLPDIVFNPAFGKKMSRAQMEDFAWWHLSSPEELCLKLSGKPTDSVVSL